MSTSKKRISEIKKIKESKINYDDIPELDTSFFKKAKIRLPEPKKTISIRVDSDILDWFKSSGPGYQTKINAVLKVYVESQGKRRKAA